MAFCGVPKSVSPTGSGLRMSANDWEVGYFTRFLTLERAYVVVVSPSLDSQGSSSFLSWGCKGAAPFVSIHRWHGGLPSCIHRTLHRRQSKQTLSPLVIPEASSARSRDGDEEGDAWLGCSIDTCETKSSAVGIRTDALQHPRSNGNEGISIGKAIYFKERVTHLSPWALAPDLRHDTFNMRCHLAVRRYGLHLTTIEGTM